MITNIEVVRRVIVLLVNSPSKPIISGVIEARRPINSTKEDIAVNSLPFDLEQLQEGVININCHVPNLELTQNGVKDNEYPNYNRINSIGKEVINIVEDYYDGELYLSIHGSTVITEPKSSYLNMRIGVRVKNI